MAEEQPTTAEQQDGPPIVVNAQYVKDLSFEVPGAPMIFARMQEAPPNINVNIDVRANPVDGNMFEVELAIHATCESANERAFILELLYAGLFTINVPQEHRSAVLLIECPRLLFPFARNILADVSRDGGFPPLMLGPVDFVQMYQAQAGRQSENQSEGAASGA